MSISLLLITSVVFSATFLPLCFSADQQYEKCQSPLRCGSGSAVFPSITYPFWGTEIDKPNYCGLSPFKLSCEDNQNLTLDIGNLTLGVVSANLDNKAITVADESLFKGGGCPKIFNFNGNDNFSLSHNTQTIDLFINCSGGSQIRSLSSISCKPSYNSTNTTYYFFGKSSPGQGCINAGEIPMVRFAKNDLYQSNLALNMALKQGFELRYNIQDKNCRDCTNSSGVCGSEPGSENFRCLCKDKPHNSSCSVNGDQG
ncbi:LEAF RUST 10 DISEASE-RESISTANCE LOCUS RECEPTOR-LIKE PROTEIN KINASE-like 2.1 [Cardamine amara subsp. amara]|uniref:non-specific serine/threonine protein kinase n=1 Tax=Cardamine amara subsp. amara TaxID=228776 RepID=A0ABD1AEU4_CARAN